MMSKRDAAGMETVWTLIRLLLLEQSDLGLHYLPRSIQPNTLNLYPKQIELIS